MKSAVWTLEVLTPVHIGSGAQWNSFDYVYDERTKLLRVIDLDKLLAQPRVNPDDLAHHYERRGFQIGQYLRDRGIAPESVERYHLPCPRDPGNRPVRAFVKTAWGKPYLPASSLKGLLRTAVLWHILRENSSAFEAALQYLERALRRDRSLPRSAQERQGTGLNVERLAEALGPDPNRDLMRAIRIEDSAELPLETLEVVEVGTYLVSTTGRLERDERLTNWAESIRPQTQISITVRWDEFLFSEMARELGFQPKRSLVSDSLTETVNGFMGTLVESEVAFYRQHGLREVADRLQDFQSGEGMLLCLGWGGGWSAKTVTRAFTDRIDFMVLRQLYKLGQSRSRRDYYDPIFPKSRRLCQEPSLMPWGWIRMRKGV
uniref:CRISPR system Cms protein Csm5 n=2 Tax=Candidatus Bipolaricaulota TaxID=67810 RepID=H5SNG8_9BACT|nr:CRISPR-associated RAMP protein Csm5 family [uncultured Acetothermia bacterium]BAL59388.1 CRISPR-associated RAMP protein Csm5 family [Candidatus Acetothermum autotrophicum]